MFLYFHLLLNLDCDGAALSDRYGVCECSSFLVHILESEAHRDTHRVQIDQQCRVSKGLVSVAHQKKVSLQWGLNSAAHIFIWCFLSCLDCKVSLFLITDTAFDILCLLQQNVHIFKVWIKILFWVTVVGTKAQTLQTDWTGSVGVKTVFICVIKSVFEIVSHSLRELRVKSLWYSMLPSSEASPAVLLCFSPSDVNLRPRESRTTCLGTWASSRLFIRLSSEYY